MRTSFQIFYTFQARFVPNMSASGNTLNRITSLQFSYDFIFLYTYIYIFFSSLRPRCYIPRKLVFPRQYVHRIKFPIMRAVRSFYPETPLKQTKNNHPRNHKNSITMQLVSAFNNNNHSSNDRFHRDRSEELLAPS